MRANAYSLQYWVYAVLVKRFGSGVLFHRDSLHKTYVANRHSFEVSTLVGDLGHLREVEAYLEGYLRGCGYVMDGLGWKKRWGGRECYIYWHKQSRGVDYQFRDKAVLCMGVGVC